MSILKLKKNGVWTDLASSVTHTHTPSDVGLSETIQDQVDVLSERVGALKVADQIEARLTDLQQSSYQHPAYHLASMIKGLSKVATTGSFADLTWKPTIWGIDKFPSSLTASDGKLLRYFNNELTFSTVEESVGEYVTANLDNYVSKTELSDKDYTTGEDIKAQLTQYVSKSELKELVQPVVQEYVENYINEALGGEY